MPIPLGPSLIKAYLRSAEAITSSPPVVIIYYSMNGYLMSEMLIENIPELRAAPNTYFLSLEKIIDAESMSSLSTPANDRLSIPLLASTK